MNTSPENTAIERMAQSPYISFVKFQSVLGSMISDHLLLSQMLILPEFVRTSQERIAKQILSCVRVNAIDDQMAKNLIALQIIAEDMELQNFFVEQMGYGFDEIRPRDVAAIEYVLLLISIGNFFVVAQAIYANSGDDHAAKKKLSEVLGEIARLSLLESWVAHPPNKGVMLRTTPLQRFAPLGGSEEEFPELRAELTQALQDHPVYPEEEGRLRSVLDSMELIESSVNEVVDGHYRTLVSAYN